MENGRVNVNFWIFLSRIYYLVVACDFARAGFKETERKSKGPRCLLLEKLLHFDNVHTISRLVDHGSFVGWQGDLDFEGG